MPHSRSTSHSGDQQRWATFSLLRQGHCWLRLGHGQGHLGALLLVGSPSDGPALVASLPACAGARGPFCTAVPVHFHLHFGCLPASLCLRTGFLLTCWLGMAAQHRLVVSAACGADAGGLLKSLRRVWVIQQDGCLPACQRGCGLLVMGLWWLCLLHLPQGEVAVEESLVAPLSCLRPVITAPPLGWPTCQLLNCWQSFLSLVCCRWRWLLLKQAVPESLMCGVSGLTIQVECLYLNTLGARSLSDLGVFQVVEYLHRLSWLRISNLKIQNGSKSETFEYHRSVKKF